MGVPNVSGEEPQKSGQNTLESSSETRMHELPTLSELGIDYNPNEVWLLWLQHILSTVCH